VLAACGVIRRHPQYYDIRPVVESMSGRQGKERGGRPPWPEGFKRWEGDSKVHTPNGEDLKILMIGHCWKGKNLAVVSCVRG